MMNITQKISELAANFDQFAVQPNLNVFKKQKYSTCLGVFITLCVGTATIAYLVVLLQELKSKSLPTIDRQVVETSEFSLMVNNFTLAISITNMGLDPLKTINHYFTITVKSCLRTKRLNSTTALMDVKNVCTNYPTKPCETDDFVTDVQKEYFSKIRLGAVQCLKRDFQEDNPPVFICFISKKLQGIASGRDYSYIVIQFSACKNTTEMQTCASPEDIRTGLSKGYYVVHISDTLLQMNSPGKISQDIIKLQYTTFSNTTSITIFQGFRIIESLTDDGWIMTDVKNDYKLIQQTYREQFSLYNEEYLVYHAILLDDKLTQYSRSYIKFQSVLSKIGGLWQILFLSAAIIFKPFIETEMYIKICNTLFRFERDDHQPEIQASSKSSLLEKLQSLNPQLESNIIQIILLTLGCSRKKKSHLETAKQQFFESIDVIGIANKSYQQEKLKYILLTEDQRRLFEFIPRLKIYKHVDENPDLMITSGRLNDALRFSRVLKTDEKCQLACKSYFKLLTYPLELNEFDKRLLSYLDDDIILLFNELHQKEVVSQEKISLDFLKRVPSYESRGKSVESQACLTPQESPAAKTLFFKNRRRNNIL